MKKKILLSWSSGKDSAWTLYLLRQQQTYEVSGLITTINSAFDRVAMHSSRRALVEMQAAAAGLPLIAVPLPWPCSNVDYECAMKKVCDEAVAQGVSAIAFGDLFLEEIRKYREAMLAATNITPLFPLWGRNTLALAKEMINAGIKAVITCVDSKKLDSSFVGRQFDEQLLSDFPSDVDPCGEHGEFHTFVYDGSMFCNSISISTGVVVERNGCVFIDILNADDAS